MVARLTRGRERYAAFEQTAVEVEEAADRLRRELLELADRDARGYETFVAARRLPRDTEAQRGERLDAMEKAAVEAVGVPLHIARAAADATALASRLAGESNPNAISDVGTAAHFAASAVRAAALNVRINLPALNPDDPLRQQAARELDRLISRSAQDERNAQELVGTRLA